MVIPVGHRNETQMLYRCVKQADGTLSKEAKLPVAFVPMVEGR
jgi:protein-L-isoaspartate O-methyltransferase